MGLQPLEIVNSFISGIDFRHQILTSKVDPRTERVQVSSCFSNWLKISYNLNQSKNSNSYFSLKFTCLTNKT